ncbi:hypothetical protein [Mesorhizobium sp.]|uniref:hypothetical protein n=1 Tax=Mesorhizobium sp. TaxID=1871066 RepID=UPI000FE48315|nr:hypothetical protein [Mesorhizobium sp.]RWD09561.1 MAG: hypothetical protein EOS74_31225 [Mesorhizobium sp.]RWF66286.1 MAG: hypothetical protein EOS47_06785 [Mesorhizobium sp.]
MILSTLSCASPLLKIDVDGIEVDVRTPAEDGENLVIAAVASEVDDPDRLRGALAIGPNQPEVAKTASSANDP